MEDTAKRASTIIRLIILFFMIYLQLFDSLYCIVIIIDFYGHVLVTDAIGRDVPLTIAQAFSVQDMLWATAAVEREDSPLSRKNKGVDLNIV